MRLAAIVIGFLVVVAAAGAVKRPAITEYPLPTPNRFPGPLTTGPDGNLWFTDAGAVAKMTTTGEVAEYPLPGFPTESSGGGPIVAGADGRLWFTEGGGIGAVTTSGSFQEFRDPTFWSYYLWGIVTGPDGNLWFTEAPREDPGTGKIGRMTPGGDLTEFTVPDGGWGPTAITVGSDGNLWFISGRSVGRITTDGAITMFPIPRKHLVPEQIVSGPDGALWFTAPLPDRIGRLTTAGNFSFYRIRAHRYSIDPAGITSGPGQQLWFGGIGGYVGSITLGGKTPKIKTYQLPRVVSEPAYITVGPDGNVWFTEPFGNTVDKLVPPA